MGPESRVGEVERHGWIVAGTGSTESGFQGEPASMTRDGSEETLFDYEEDRGYDLGEGD